MLLIKNEIFEGSFLGKCTILQYKWVEDLFCFSLQVVHMSDQPALVILGAGLFGFFALALVPACLEVGVECTYPVAEATSAGLQWMMG